MPVQCLVHQKATEIAQKVYNNWQWQYSTEIIYTTAMHVKRTDIIMNVWSTTVAQQQNFIN